MSPCAYESQEPTEKLVAAGWLDPDHPYTRGQLSNRTFERLCAMFEDPFDVWMYRGPHDCGFCNIEGGSTIECGGRAIRVGTANLFVPSVSPSCVFVMPSLAIHYIQAHDYCPPEPFARAVDRCPPFESQAYLAELLAHGPRESMWWRFILSRLGIDARRRVMLQGNTAALPFLAEMAGYKDHEGRPDGRIVLNAAKCLAEVGDGADALVPVLVRSRDALEEMGNANYVGPIEDVIRSIVDRSRS